MKKCIAIALLISLALPSFAIKYEDLNMPKPPAYRTGLSEEPEKEYMEAPAENKVHQEYVKKDAEQFDVSDLTYADLSIKQISREVAADLELDQENMVGDLSVLWQGAASQSDTINFALYKLANPDEDKPDEKSVKKVLTTIASMSTLVGAGMGRLFDESAKDIFFSATVSCSPYRSGAFGSIAAIASAYP